MAPTLLIKRIPRLIMYRSSVCKILINIAYMQCKGTTIAAGWQLIGPTSVCISIRCNLGRKAVVTVLQYSCRHPEFCCHSYSCTQNNKTAMFVPGHSLYMYVGCNCFAAFNMKQSIHSSRGVIWYIVALQATRGF